MLDRTFVFKLDCCGESACGEWTCELKDASGEVLAEASISQSGECGTTVYGVGEHFGRTQTFKIQYTMAEIQKWIKNPRLGFIEADKRARAAYAEALTSAPPRKEHE
jgi:hypothetical protein